MTALPAVFVSHGAPTLALETCPAQRFLQALSAQFPTPHAVLVVSAHHDTAPLSVTTSARPATMHDFYGFDPALDDLRYPAPGSPILAQRVIERLACAGIRASADPDRGLDHGAWIPLLLAYPTADIPVVQLSIDAQRDARWHLDIGRALQPLRDEGVLILASGSTTHNLRALFRAGTMPSIDEAPPPWVSAFSDWLAERLSCGDTRAVVVHWRDAPHATDNHPTPEHFLPLFVAMGAGGTPTCLHRSTTYGVLAMDAYAFA